MFLSKTFYEIWVTLRMQAFALITCIYKQDQYNLVGHSWKWCLEIVWTRIAKFWQMFWDFLVHNLSKGHLLWRFTEICKVFNVIDVIKIRLMYLLLHSNTLLLPGMNQKQMMSKMVFLKISEYSQENTCIGVSF